MADKRTAKGSLLKKFLQNKDEKKEAVARKNYRNFKRASNNRIIDLQDRKQDLIEQQEALVDKIASSETATSKENFSRLVSYIQEIDLCDRDYKDSTELFVSLFGEDPKSFD